MMQSFRSRLRDALRSTGCQVREDLTGSQRRIKFEVFPRYISEAVTAVKVATRERIQIQPVSCGRNWGFGSGLPSKDDCLILNFSEMNRVRQLPLSRHTVEVEPGVTQGQLADELSAAGDTHFLNVTGAGLSTSVLGNALERGIGYFGSRECDLIGAEVLLPNAEIIRIGHGAHSAAHGASVGPALEGLLVQSGWGIVTAGTFRLRRRSEHMGGVILGIHHAPHLPCVVNELGTLLSEGWLGGVPHIFNQLRLETTFGGTKAWPSWGAVIPVRGPRLLVKAMVDELKRRFCRRADVRTLNLGFPDDENGPLDAISPLLAGRPIDLALFSMARTITATDAPSSITAFDPEQGNAGLIHVTPSCALDDLSRLLALVKRTANAHGWVKLPLSFNLVSERHGCLVISVCFKRDSAVQKAAARQFATNLLRQCTEEDFQPYRLGLGQAEDLMPFEPALARLCQRLGQVIDPKGLLAPSRYSHLWTQQNKWPEEVPPLLAMIEQQQLRTSKTLCAKNAASS